MTAALYRRYRPDTFDDVIGQEHVTEALKTALDTSRVAHAFLFSGPRGCGKTTSARILARSLNCAEGPTATPCGKCESCVELASGGPGSLDVVEIDAASHSGVDDARELRDRVTFAPTRDRYRIFILDEAHMVSPAGFNALLKVVEEPPEHVKFIFATTEPDKVITTIRSRTHHYPFRLVGPKALLPYLQSLAEREGVEIEDAVYPLLIRAGGGSVRDTLSAMDQLIAGADGNVTAQQANYLLGYTDSALLDRAVEALGVGDGAQTFQIVEEIIEAGHEPRQFTMDLLQRFRDMMVCALAQERAADILVEVPADTLTVMQMEAHRWGPRMLSRRADIVEGALREMTVASAPRMQLELLLARLLVTEATSPQVDAPARPAAQIPHPPAAAAPHRASVQKVTPSRGVPREGEPQPERTHETKAGSPASAPAPQSAASAARKPTQVLSEPPVVSVERGSGPTKSEVRDQWFNLLDALGRQGGLYRSVLEGGIADVLADGGPVRFLLKDERNAERLRNAGGEVRISDALGTLLGQPVEATVGWVGEDRTQTPEPAQDVPAVNHEPTGSLAPPEDGVEPDASSRAEPKPEPAPPVTAQPPAPLAEEPPTDRNPPITTAADRSSAAQSAEVPAAAQPRASASGRAAHFEARRPEVLPPSSPSTLGRPAGSPPPAGPSSFDSRSETEHVWEPAPAHPSPSLREPEAPEPQPSQPPPNPWKGRPPVDVVLGILGGQVIEERLVEGES